MRNKPNVLVIDDDPMLRKTLCDILEAKGFEATSAKNGTEGLAISKQRFFNIAIIDLKLPDLSGLEVMNEIKGNAPSTETIILTGNATMDSAIEATNKGAFSYLVKPYDIEQLLLQIKRALERQLAEEKIKHMAYHDALTGLPNRMLFNDRLATALRMANRNNLVLALMILDLDHFKNVNDTLGHDKGDRLLQLVSERISDCLRASDTVSRLGGDEFAVLLPQITEAEDSFIVAQKILDALSLPFHFDGHELRMSSSIGIAIYPDDGRDAETLFKNSDIALYDAKEHGRNNYKVFALEMNKKAAKRMTIENNLRKALESKEFILHYQPLVDLATGQIVVMEALIRWQHPEAGLLYPEDFISVAEKSGLILPIGEWVLRSACVQCREWRKAGLEVRVAVNLSASQFRNRNLRESVKQLLEETDLYPEYLDLELTESALVDPEKVTIDTMKELNKMGIRLSVDGFGTGYSALSYLKRFPVSKLKIVQTFIKSVAVDPSDAAIATAIVAMAHSLGLRAVAEGVEKPEQLEFLRSIQCDEAQGLLFSPPLPAEEATKMLAEGKRLQC